MKILIYFDNAATSGKKPQNVINAVNLALKNYSVNIGRGGYKEAVKASEAVFNVREKVSDYFHASGPQNVVFTASCTQSINCVLKGVLKRGDHVVVSSLEHNAVMRPLVKLKNPFSVAEVSFTDDETTLNNFKRAVKPNTKLIFCTAASNVAGKVLPIEKIGKFCKERGILFGVDAAQGAGVLPIDMKKMKIDFLCIAAHKGLFSPMGIGILICEKNIPETLIEGGTGTNSLDFFQPDVLPERLESGTLNLPAIFGIGAGIDFLKQKGMENLYTHEMKLTQDLYRKLSNNPKIVLYTPFPQKNMFAPVLCFNVKNIPSEKTANHLAKNNIAVRGGYHCAPTAHKQMRTLESGAVRASFSFFNTEKEISVFSQVLSKIKT